MKAILAILITASVVQATPVEVVYVHPDTVAQCPGVLVRKTVTLQTKCFDKLSEIANERGEVINKANTVVRTAKGKFFQLSDDGNVGKRQVTLKIRR